MYFVAINGPETAHFSLSDFHLSTNVCRQVHLHSSWHPRMLFSSLRSTIPSIASNATKIYHFSFFQINHFVLLAFYYYAAFLSNTKYTVIISYIFFTYIVHVHLFFHNLSISSNYIY